MIMMIMVMIIKSCISKKTHVYWTSTFGINFKVDGFQGLKQCDLRPIQYLPKSGWEFVSWEGYRVSCKANKSN